MKVVYYDYINKNKSDKIDLNDYKVSKLKDIYLASFELDENIKLIIHHNKIETALILLSGCIKITDTEYDVTFHVERESVFHEKASTVFMPNFGEIIIDVIENSQIIVCGAQIEKENRSQSILITHENIKSKRVGKETFSRRVDTIIDKDYPAQKILIGETFNDDGKWSSFPSHKHDVNTENIESCHEEVYFFKIKQKYGFGFQRIYSKDESIDETFTVKDNCLSIIPKGYHPVVASPGIDLYYFWILSGKQRKLLMNTDPTMRHLL